MSSIRILPDTLSNRIAAGEVVERPASVVKELVENALDAGSTRIVVEVEKGGRSLIRVADNGSGMDHDDALLALERYATSKIFSDEDLFSIKTLGFRGEALPSIAAVSRFTLVTRKTRAIAGTEIRMDGGKMKNVSAAGAPTGTMVTVKQLFFNTPARRKFLKTIRTEMGHIGEVVACMAIGYPEVDLKLVHNGKIVKTWPATADITGRVIDILGPELQPDLFPVQFDNGPISLTGWIVSPRQTRSTSRGIYTFVNGRFVRDRVILQALQRGYGRRLMKGRYPMAVLFISLPHDRVDVNVHPSKNEVRFSDQKQMAAAVSAMAAGVLAQSDRPSWSPSQNPEPTPRDGNKITEAAVVWDEDRRPNRSAAGPSKRLAPPAGSSLSARDNPPVVPSPPENVLSGRLSRPKEKKSMKPAREPALQERLWQMTAFSDLHILGQFQNTYIIGAVGDRLVAIDQHAAHERILFERLKNQSDGAPGEAQRLLVPEVVDLGYREAEALKPLLPGLRDAGLDIEYFGGNSFAVKAVPAFLTGREMAPLIGELAESAIEAGTTDGLEAIREQCLTVIACHGAIRAKYSLDYRQMKDLLEKLDGCLDPAHCPHGRPTWIEWHRAEIEKLFGRVK